MEITPLVDVQSSVNTRGKLLLWVSIDIEALRNVGRLELEVMMPKGFHKTLT